MEVAADIRSTNRYVTVKAAEYFLDSTNGVTFGAGSSMTATDGTFNSTNEIAVGTFTPSFPYGERHEIFIHAQGKDKQWCPFKKVIINPNINDILDKIQANYSAFQDVSYDATDSVVINGVTISSASFHIKQKGGYKMRLENVNTGSTEIGNYNYAAYVDAGSHTNKYLVGYSSRSDVYAAAVHGPSGVREFDYLSDFFWDIQTLTNSYSVGLDSGFAQGVNGLNYVAASAGSETIHLVVDFKVGIPVSKTQSLPSGTPSTTQYSSPVEILDGKWMTTQQVDHLSLADGGYIEWRTSTTNVRVNQGLDDALFNISLP